MKGMDSEQTKKRAVKPDINVKMRLFVRIDGISPFVLRLVANLHNDHYKEIVEQYYNELYQGRTPGLLYLTKIVNFQGGDKLFVYKRREGMSTYVLTIYSDSMRCRHCYLKVDPSSLSRSGL